MRRINSVNPTDGHFPRARDLTGLGQIHASLRAMSAQDGCKCQGLNVTVYDPDVVTQFNIGRQLFYQTDLGQNKALCLVGRVNMA